MSTSWIDKCWDLMLVEELFADQRDEKRFTKYTTSQRAKSSNVQPAFTREKQINGINLCVRVPR